MGVMNKKRPTATQGAMNHANPSFSTQIFAGAVSCGVKFVALLRYVVSAFSVMQETSHA
jgi:hypothetical protein